MPDEEAPVAAHQVVASGGPGNVDRIKAALVVAATVASVLVALVAARSFALIPH